MKAPLKQLALLTAMLLIAVPAQAEDSRIGLKIQCLEVDAEPVEGSFICYLDNFLLLNHKVRERSPGVLGTAQFAFLTKRLEQRSDVAVLGERQAILVAGRGTDVRIPEVIPALDETVPTNRVQTVCLRYDPNCFKIAPIGELYWTVISTNVSPLEDLAINALPDIAADGYTIHLALRPAPIEIFGYREEVKKTLPAPMTFRYRRTFNASLWDGQTVVLQSPVLEQAGKSTSRKTRVLVFITANIVDAAGKPVRGPLPFAGAGIPPQSSEPGAAHNE